MDAAAAREYVELTRSLPIPEQIDWEDAPGQFKLYRGHPRIPLDESGTGGLARLLRDCYGVTRYRWTAADALRRLIGTRGAEPAGGAKLARNSLRPVPSGGSRFPAELYVVTGPGAEVPPGVHHYDQAHHALVTLREGDWTAELGAALGMAGAAPALTLLTSAFFWKNGFKYADLTYRLCALDVGVLLGQVLAVAAARTAGEVRYRFADDDLDRLLRLDPMRESVYTAVTFGSHGEAPPSPRRLADAAQPSRTNTLSDSEQEWSLDARPLQARLHRGSRLSAVAAVAAPPAITASGSAGGPELRLSGHRVALLDGLRTRRSSMGYFTPAGMSLDTLSALLAPALDGYRNDLADTPAVRHTMLYCVVNRVDSVAPGVYRLRPGETLLEPVRLGDLSGELQESLLIKLFNLAHTNLCVYPVGDYEAGFGVHGDRWYRMQNIEAGVVTQRLYLACAALGLRCHASLGYDVRRTDRLLGLDGTGATSLIQVMIGSGRPPGDFYEAAWH
ncbi:SagB/ThcOx family dehydrogenase [Couchioplanes azureus]|uniref:SagB/ThcOx family dehydrogenase n=1 Tax=Couchioplanes caeruleus TaxID=56438 RepID=UPI0016713C8D|nr:SagB family peptide dehydrogenase [Couchioplanes caeruleus]